MSDYEGEDSVGGFPAYMPRLEPVTIAVLLSRAVALLAKVL